VEALNPFHNRQGEWELYSPLIGKTMLELGNKRNGDAIYKKYFESLGFSHISVDYNGEDGALKLDLRQPLNLGTFDMVSNIGTTEHVETDQHLVWENILKCMHVGSVLVSTTPKPGQWVWHGDWYPSAEFYQQLADLNGLKVERLYDNGVDPRVMVFARLVKTEEKPFVMPAKETMVKNHRVNKYGYTSTR
jgi:hypothetical protein